MRKAFKCGFIVAGGALSYFVLKHLKSKKSKQQEHLKEPTTVMVVLTGGPCGGKTSAKERLTKDLNDAGYNVLFVPEVPTILIQGGAPYPGLDGGARLIEFEYQLLKLQENIEDCFRGLANCKSDTRPCVIICDRAMMDIEAYISQEQWCEVIGKLGVCEAHILARYNVVVHLVTAADGAAEFYTSENNAARTETALEAIEVDNKIRNAWNAHPCRLIINNEGSFADKLDAVSAGVLVALEGLK